MEDKDFVALLEQITEIEDKLEELYERIENIENLIKEEKENQLKKLQAELEYAKFRWAYAEYGPSIMICDRCIHNNVCKTLERPSRPGLVVGCSGFLGWIPVTERPPKINVDVIVTDIETTDTYLAHYLGDGFWECDNGPYNNRIIAWTPLPEPYKEPSFWWKCEKCGKLIPYMADFCYECADKLLGEPPKPFEPPAESEE